MVRLPSLSCLILSYKPTTYTTPTYNATKPNEAQDRNPPRRSLQRKNAPPNLPKTSLPRPPNAPNGPRRAMHLLQRFLPSIPNIPANLPPIRGISRRRSSDHIHQGNPGLRERPSTRLEGIAGSSHGCEVLVDA